MASDYIGTVYRTRFLGCHVDRASSTWAHARISKGSLLSIAAIYKKAAARLSLQLKNWPPLDKQYTLTGDDVTKRSQAEAGEGGE